MKKANKMNQFKYILLFMTCLSLLFFASCDDDDPADNPVPTETEKEKLVAALTTKTWTVDVTNTNVANSNGALDASTFTISFTSTSAGANYTLGGDIASFLTGGSFDIDTDANVTNLTLNVASGVELDAVVTAFTVTENSFEVTASISDSNGRIAGLGDYVFVFTAS